MNFVDKFINHCKNDNDYIAVVDNNGKNVTSYGKLFIISKKIASKLIKCGAKKNDNIVIVLPKCMEYIASIYGILFAGCCYVPLSDDYSVDRKNKIIDHTDAKIVIDKNFISDIDTFDEIENINITDDQNATIVYTSGSEGEPKGVYYTFRDLNDAVSRNSIYMKDFEFVSMLYISPFYFIVHILCLIQLSFDFPGTVHLITSEKTKDINFINDYLDEYKIDNIFVLPRIFKYINKGKYLKVVLVGAERVSNVYADRFKVICSYCQTEGMQSFFVLDKKYEVSPIGKPLSGTNVKIMNEEGCEVKNGEVGEICGIGHFATGYYKDEESTRKTFVKLDDGNILIHTGDMGYINEHGLIVYLDRIDNMLKLNGKRVEPGEIENVIKRIDFIDECVVKAIKNSNIDLLCAFYTTKNHMEISSNRIIEFIWNKLPSYMIPSRFIYCDSFQYNNNGKIDRKTLQINDDFILNRKITAPESEMEKIIIDAFSETLGISPISRDDDFFQIGGSSLLVMKLVTILEKYNIGVQDIYVNRTPENIAKFCKPFDEEKLDKENEEALKHDQKLNPTNEKLWVLDHLKDTNKVNGSVIPMIIELKKGIVDLEKLSNCTYEVFKCHPSLLSILVKDSDGYKLRYKPDILQKIEILNIKDEELDDVVYSMMKIDEETNITNYKCKIISTNNSDYFVFSQLHYVADNYTFSLLIKQIVENYIYGTIPKKDYFYLYLQNIHNMYVDPKNKEILEHIKNDFNDHEYDEKIAYDKTDYTSEKGKAKNLCNLGQSQKAMELYAKNIGVSVSTIYIASALKTLSEYNKHKKVKINWVYHGRDYKYKNDIAGCMLSTFTIKIDFEIIHSNKELLDEIEKQSKSYFAMSDLVSTFDFEKTYFTIDHLNMDNENNELSEILKVRNDFFAKRMTSELFSSFMFITEYDDKNKDVCVLISASDIHYCKESIDKFMDMFKRNLYNILELKY